MNQIDTLKNHGRSSIHSATAIDCLTVIGSDPALCEALQAGVSKYGASFAAYLLGTDAYQLPPSKLLSTFATAEVGSYDTEDEALEAVVRRLGWLQVIEQLQETDGNGKAIDFLTWKADELRDHLSGEFAFVQLLSQWAVFDLVAARRNSTRCSTTPGVSHQSIPAAHPTYHHPHFERRNHHEQL